MGDDIHLSLAGFNVVSETDEINDKVEKDLLPLGELLNSFQMQKESASDLTLPTVRGEFYCLLQRTLKVENHHYATR